MVIIVTIPVMLGGTVDDLSTMGLRLWFWKTENETAPHSGPSAANTTLLRFLNSGLWNVKNSVRKFGKHKLSFNDKSASLMNEIARNSVTWLSLAYSTFWKSLSTSDSLNLKLKCDTTVQRYQSFEDRFCEEHIARQSAVKVSGCGCRSSLTHF